MKKILLIALVLGFSVSLMAQKANLQEDAEKYSVKVSASDLIRDNGSNTNSDFMHSLSKKFSIDEEQVGNTQYDLQSNSALSNRAHRYEDGSMAFVWTMGLESAPNFPDRGTGYNFFDGSSWNDMPTERIEDENTGWPSYAPLGENGEIVVSHTGTNLKISTRENKGTGEWNYQEFAGPEGHDILWPKVATNGNTIHMVGNLPNTANGGSVYEGLDGAMLYSRSTDGGETWVDENILLPGLTSDEIESINADDYILETNGDIVTILISGPWLDLILMKSEDNGENWEKTVIWENLYNNIPLEDIVTTDTMWAPDGSLTSEIDSEGKVHVAFGLTRYLKEEAGDEWSYFPFTDGIIYWNENMEPLEDEENQHDALSYDNLEEDVNYVAWTPDVDGDGTIDIGENELYSYRTGGMATQVSMQMDEDDDILLVYTVPREDLFAGEFHYRHVYGRSKAGSTWEEPFDLTGGEIHMFDECIYPQVANINPDDEHIHIFYQKDNTPGLALDEDHDWVDNQIVHLKASWNEFGTVSNENGITTAESHKVSQNYPNPVTGSATVDVELSEKANVSFNIVNMVGQSVYTEDRGAVNAGTHQFNINARDFETGVYFYNVTIDGQKTTKKMVIR